MNRNASMADLIQAKFDQHVQSFKHLVENEISKDDAWQMIMDRTTFGPALLDSLKAKCFEVV